eukprot:1155416-Pelagomonas_calceolata.AAC.2
MPSSSKCLEASGRSVSLALKAPVSNQSTQGLDADTCLPAPSPHRSWPTPSWPFPSTSSAPSSQMRWQAWWLRWGAGGIGRPGPGWTECALRAMQGVCLESYAKFLPATYVGRPGGCVGGLGARDPSALPWLGRACLESYARCAMGPLKIVLEKQAIWTECALTAAQVHDGQDIARDTSLVEMSE